ncbi:thiamine-phosphate kinase [Cricetibacter osteomyelitidis]|uniref:Thiamine-monophosphate kinase n=1 Tax=Cricetibacter osteomyelitidis TaxID=1521931 RepID=A0A4R2SXB0_9PAST|nr:thiamine-phosphate kinase [Cricetibacter osteomyelitidis]TCP95127.1 thiamine-phosphate kinase [Cricetibacter osteomyelitidis]
MNGEFDIIQRYFMASNRPPRKDVILAVGDDCAITELNKNQRLAITTDTLVENTHFLPDISAADLAYKSVAVNLSDLAAMGAEPAWISLALTLPKVDHLWLSEFSESFFQILDHYNVELIGGDTTKGQLSLTLTAQGILQKGRALCRHSAKAGDWIYVSGSLGDSAAGLELLLQDQSAVNFAEKYLIQRHLRPTPRVLLGLELAMSELSCTAIDVSDGFLADLGHILARSQCSAMIELDKLPLSAELIETVGLEKAQHLALCGGEDYELCFTVPEINRAKLDRTLANLNVPYTCVGQIRAAKQAGNITFQQFGQTVELSDFRRGFDHFG